MYHELLDQGIDPTDDDDDMQLRISRTGRGNEWRVAWYCPECDEDMSHEFDGYPGLDEIIAIQNNPLCNDCLGTLRKLDDACTDDETTAEYRDNRRRALEWMDGLRRGMGLDDDKLAEARTDYADPLN